MHPHVDASPWPEDLPFPPEAAVYDLVYNPGETRVVRAARAAGLPAVTGLGMLVEQAALSLERWVGQAVPREAMWAELQVD
jgi:shikimate dehydrogenase